MPAPKNFPIEISDDSWHKDVYSSSAEAHSAGCLLRETMNGFFPTGSWSYSIHEDKSGNFGILVTDDSAPWPHQGFMTFCPSQLPSHIEGEAA